jgi:hypothetical protein
MSACLTANLPEMKTENGIFPRGIHEELSRTISERARKIFHT